ncbi:MAG TPA: vitamin K epoxide reductase family protein [Acidimicrobiales bacterium]|nr:vitamin K epoxide reductase family protein [Acidimicrobiales bacterium]
MAVPRWVTVSTLALSVVAFGISAYLTYAHYADPTSLACPDTGTINCTKVTTSSYAVIFGIPVAVFGLAWAAAVTAINVPWAWRSAPRWVHPLRLALVAGGAGMVLYLVYVELFRIGAICLWCTGVHVTAVALFTVVLLSRPSEAE